MIDKCFFMLNFMCFIVTLSFRCLKCKKVNNRYNFSRVYHKEVLVCSLPLVLSLSTYVCMSWYMEFSLLSRNLGLHLNSSK